MKTTSRQGRTHEGNKAARRQYKVNTNLWPYQYSYLRRIAQQNDCSLAEAFRIVFDYAIIETAKQLPSVATDGKAPLDIDLPTAVISLSDRKARYTNKHWRFRYNGRAHCTQPKGQGQLALDGKPGVSSAP